MSVSTFVQPDYSSQSGSSYKGNLDGAAQVLHGLGGAFAPHQQTVANMTVRLDAGRIFGHNSGLTEVAAQNSATITAPSGNPRHDIVYIDRLTGSAGVATGSESATPADPSVPAHKVPVARVRLATSTTAITNSLIDDLRVTGPVFEPSAGGSITPTLSDLVVLGDASNSNRQGYSTIQAVLALADGADQVARDMAASALILADLNGVAGTKGAFYLADPFTGDTLAVKTNAAYDSSGDYYAPSSLDILPTMSSGTTSGVTISASGNNSGDDPWKAADDSTTTHWTITATSGIWTVQLSGAATISIYTITGINTGGTVNGGSPNTSMPPQAWTLQGSNNGSDWTTVDTVTGQTGWSSLQKRTFTVDSPGSYSYYRLNITSNNGSSYTSLCEVELLGAPQNVTLRPTAATLLTADPDDLMGYFGFDPQEAVTAGTDFIGKGSIDGGSTWATGSWTRVGSVQTDEEIWRLDVDVSSQTGSSVIYEITTANNKSLRYTRCGGVVPLY